MHFSGASDLAADHAKIIELNTYISSVPDRLVLTHAWSESDVVIYDNRCVLHRGRAWDDAGTTPRRLVRVAVGGGVGGGRQNTRNRSPTRRSRRS